MAHLGQSGAEHLDATHEAGSTDPPGLVGEPVELMRRQLHELGRHQRQETVAEVADQLLRERARLRSEGDRVGDHGQGAACVAVDHGLDELVEWEVGDAVVSGARHEFERGQRVAGRPATASEHLVDRRVADLEAGIGGNPANVFGERVGREQVELEVLGAADDRGRHLLRVGGGQDEHDV